jgi:hypothetical protein
MDNLYNCVVRKEARPFQPLIQFNIFCKQAWRLPECGQTLSVGPNQTLESGEAHASLLHSFENYKGTNFCSEYPS